MHNHAEVGAYYRDTLTWGERHIGVILPDRTAVGTQVNRMQILRTEVRPKILRYPSEVRTTRCNTLWA